MHHKSCTAAYEVQMQELQPVFRCQGHAKPSPYLSPRIKVAPAVGLRFGPGTVGVARQDAN